MPSSNLTAKTDDWDDWLTGHAAGFLLFARQQTRCEADAEDVLQEALVETWKRAQGRPETPLVFATIRRRAIDLGRRTDRRVQREVATAADAAPEFGWFQSLSQDTELAAMLETEIRSLPPAQRDVLTLKVWGSLTFSEIAESLQIPQGTAASRYRLALESLRQSLSTVIS